MNDEMINFRSFFTLSPAFLFLAGRLFRLSNNF